MDIYLQRICQLTWKMETNPEPQVQTEDQIKMVNNEI